MLTGLLIVLFVAATVHFERRLSRLERLVAGGQPFAPAAIQWTEPQGAPDAPGEHEREEASQREAADVADPRPSATILYAEPKPAPESSTSEADGDPAVRTPFVFSIEDLFGRRLPIWAGGITLAVAGIFIVKLSIEAGLLSPSVRVISGMVFGVSLIAAAEAALRWHERVRDLRVRQALAGAGIASLYASILIAANLYHLIEPLVAMLGVAVVTGAAMLLSIRFGAPTALLGLAGGLAAPALVGSEEPNVPLLALYLALAVGGLATLSRNQRWAWLGIGALIGGFGWGLVLLLGGVLDTAGSISVGLYILLLGVGIPALGLAGERRDQVRLISGIVAAAQMAALVATGGFTLLNWVLFGAISVATAWLAAREPALERLPPVGLAIALLLAGVWPNPQPGRFALVLAGIAIIHGFMPLRRLWSDRGGLLDAAQLAAILLGSWIVSMVHFHLPDGANDLSLGLLALGLSLAVALIAALGWKTPRRAADASFAIVATSGGLLLAGAATLLLPAWASGLAIGAIGLGALELGRMAEDRRFEPIAWIFAGAGLVAGFTPDAAFANARPIDTLRFAAIAVVAGLFAWRGRYRAGRMVSQFLSPLFLFAAASLWADDPVEPLIPALMLVGLAWVGGHLRGERLIPAMTATSVLIMGWAAEPMAEWTRSATASLAALPILVGSVPAVEPALTRMLVPGALAGLAGWLASGRLEAWQRTVITGLSVILCAVGLHSLYKQLFAIDSTLRFISLGLAERTVWEAWLLGVAALALHRGRRRIALGFAAAAAAHFALYTLVLHNPLWAEQSVGAVPVFNWLLPAYALPLALILVVGRMPEMEEAGLKRPIAILQMLLIALLSYSMLRQLFHGSLLVEPGLGQAEDIGRSIVAIALAIGFLLWGIAREDRDWRVASLILMIAAVVKVFLFDASGLEGLVRIASFIALGLSLIGIGWLYSRNLSGEDAQLAKLGSSR